MLLSALAHREIDRLYHGRNHVELIIGIRQNGRSEIIHFGPDRRVNEDIHLVYPVGSI